MPDTPQAAETNLDPTHPYAPEAQVNPRLTPKMAGRIAGYGTEERLPRGSLVFQREQRGVDLFFILDGSIEVFDADERGRPNVFTTHGVRQFTGGMDLFNDRRIPVYGRTGPCRRHPAAAALHDPQRLSATAARHRRRSRRWQPGAQLGVRDHAGRHLRRRRHPLGLGQAGRLRGWRGFGGRPGHPRLPAALLLYPGLKRIAVVRDEAEGQRFRAAGMQAVVDRGEPPGIDVAATVLIELGIEASVMDAWMRRQQARALGTMPVETVTA